MCRSPSVSALFVGSIMCLWLVSVGGSDASPGWPELRLFSFARSNSAAAVTAVFVILGSSLRSVRKSMRRGVEARWRMSAMDLRAASIAVRSEWGSCAR